MFILLQYVSGALNSIRRLSHVPLTLKRSKQSSEKEKADSEEKNNNGSALKYSKLEIEAKPEKSPKKSPPKLEVPVEGPPAKQVSPPKIYKTPAIFASDKPAFPPQPVPVIISNPTPPMTAYVESRPGSSPLTPETPAPFQVDDEFNLPVSLALFILVLYILLGSFIFTFTDNWRLFESFYFVYISMSTIGFGDYVPNSSLSMIASSIYLLFGLALTSMCINVIQERLSESFERAKVHIGAQLGFDVNQMAPEPNQLERRSEVGKQVGFELKTNNIGQSLRQKREQRRSSERSSSISASDMGSERPSDQSSERSSLDRASNRSSQVSQKSTESSDGSSRTLIPANSGQKSRSLSPVKYSDL